MDEDEIEENLLLISKEDALNILRKKTNLIENYKNWYISVWLIIIVSTPIILILTAILMVLLSPIALIEFIIRWRTNQKEEQNENYNNNIKE
jgi:hypothetical protein